MRPRFESDLRSMNEVAKDELDIEKRGDLLPEDENIPDISSVLDWHLEKISEKQHTSVDVQHEIYEIQKKKQEIVQKLKDDLACLDNPDCNFEKIKGSRDASYSNGAFVYADDKQSKWAATFGEIVTDMNWDLVYNLDKKTTPRTMLKKYLVEKSKKELLSLLDSQITKSEVEGDFIDDFKKHAYSALEEDKQTGVKNERWGSVSEAMVKSFLSKLSIDADLPFTIKDADAFQDVEQKIDFIIHRKERNRGVGVESSESATDIGVQFTVNDLAVDHKIKQINRSMQTMRRNNEDIQDIALVVFPLNMAMQLKKMWNREGRPSGGPDRYMEKRKAELLFTALLKDIFTQEEISEYWKKVEGNFA